MLCVFRIFTKNNIETTERRDLHLYKLLSTNDDFLVISKSQAIPFHKGTAATGLVETIRNNENLDQLFPVHRLDTMTSGIIVFAKNKMSAQEIAKLFRERKIQKFYIALAPGTPKKKQGTVKGDMIKGRNGVWILSHSMNKPAITQFFSAGLGNGLRLYILKPYTGRTHQLRVMMKSLSVPILGDPAYYKEKKNTNLICDRGYLHAYTIQFTFKGVFYSFTDFPFEGLHFQTEQFNSIFTKYKEPWNLQWPAIRKS